MIGKAIHYLRGKQDHIVTSANVVGAIEEFHKAKFGTVFLDMMLEGQQNWLDVLRGMLKEKPDTRIVLLTALPEDNPSVVSAIGLGAFGHLKKPIRLESLGEMLHQFEIETGSLKRIK
ncbi:MAG: response regulator [Candidatus Thermoplasmatota archaeon]